MTLHKPLLYHSSFFFGGGRGGGNPFIICSVQQKLFVSLQIGALLALHLKFVDLFVACHSLADNSSMEVSIVTSPKDIMVFPLKEELYSFGLTNVDILELDCCIYCCHFKLMMCGNPGN